MVTREEGYQARIMEADIDVFCSVELFWLVFFIFSYSNSNVISSYGPVTNAYKDTQSHTIGFKPKSKPYNDIKQQQQKKKKKHEKNKSYITNLSQQIR